jgi:hypothetical protein
MGWTPVAGDIVILAPLDWRIRFAETRGTRAEAVEAIGIGWRRQDTITPTGREIIRAQIYTADRNETFVNMLGTPVGRLMALEDLKKSDNRVFVPRRGSRAHSVALSGTAMDCGKMALTGFVEEAS